MRHGGVVILLLMAVAAQSPVSGQQKAPVHSGTAGGLRTATFDTPHGKVTVNLPDDMAGGDVISGTVVAEPAGKTEGEVRTNADVLSGYVVEVEKSRTPVSGRMLKWAIPAALGGGVAYALLKDRKGKEIGRTALPVRRQPVASTGRLPGAPSDFYLPPIWQAGKPVEILGPFGGDFANTQLRFGGTEVDKLAESPRKLVVASPRQVVGPASVELKEDDVTVSGECRNISQNLSAGKTTLRTNETTVLTDKVEGLQDLHDEIQIQLENRSSQVVRMERGDAQTTFIRPQDVQPGGVGLVTRMLTGIRPGQFNIIATVYPEPINRDQWAAEKGLIETPAQFGQWVDSVKKDLDAYAKKGGMKPAEAEDIKGRLDACKELARTDMEAALRCADLVLRGVTVVQVAAKLWLSGFELYKTAIELIVNSLKKDEAKIPWELINKTLDFLIEGADAVEDKEGGNKLREAKKLKEAAEKGEKVMDKLKEALEKLKDYTPEAKK